MIKVLFVCHGNICRSPMAEFLFKHIVQRKGVFDKFEIASAATSSEEIGNPVHPGAASKLALMGISTEGKKAVQFTRDDYRYYDHIIIMDQNNLKNLQRLMGETSLSKVNFLMDFSDNPRQIKDPWYTEDFDAAYSDIWEGCLSFFDYLKRKGEL